MRVWKSTTVKMSLMILAAAVFGCDGAGEEEGGYGGPTTTTVGESAESFNDSGAQEPGVAIGAEASQEWNSSAAPTEDWDGEAGEEYNAAPQDPSLSEEGGDQSMEEGLDEEAIEELPEELIVEEEGPDFETTNPYVLVESQPTSTFASDSDTASYDMFRQGLSNNQIMDAKSVRLEEFINAFEYDYPAPEEGSEDPFKVNLELAESPFTEGASILRIGIQGEKIERNDFEGVNLVFLVDVSGSMGSAGKMPLVKTMLTEAVHQLGSNDRISIVTYSGIEKVALASTPVEDKDAIIEVINNLGTGGGTAGAAGLAMAYDQAEAGWIEGGINHVVLCTDGDFNVGISSNAALVEFIEEKRESNVTLTAVGFGVWHNDDMMEQVSNAGNGTYKLVTDADDAVDYASDGLISSLFFIAKDVKIQVEFNMDSVYAYRKLGYENRELEDWMFHDVTIDAGEIPQDHAVTAIYELVPVGQSLPEVDGAPALMTDIVEPLEMEITPEEMVLVKIRYKETGATSEDPSRQVAESLAFDEAPLPFADAGADLRFASAVAAFAEILKTSPYSRPDLAEDIRAIVEETSGNHMDREQLSVQMQTAFDLLEL